MVLSDVPISRMLEPIGSSSCATTDQRKPMRLTQFQSILVKFNVHAVEIIRAKCHTRQEDLVRNAHKISLCARTTSAVSYSLDTYSQSKLFKITTYIIILCSSSNRRTSTCHSANSPYYPATCPLYPATCPYYQTTCPLYPAHCPYYPAICPYPEYCPCYSISSCERD